MSTRGKNTISKENYLLINHILTEINNKEYKTSHDKPFYEGFIIKSVNNSFGNKKVAGIQLEFGSNIRFKKDAREDVFREISIIMIDKLDY